MIIVNILFLLVINVVNPNPYVRHDFHVGITEIRYAPGSETYQITIQLFTHDLEAAVLKSSGESLQLKTRYEKANADSIIFDYTADKFSLKADGKVLRLTNIGRETLSDDETFIYLESESTAPQSALWVKNTLLMEVFENQTQIINIVQGGETHSTTLSVKNPFEIISL